MYKQLISILLTIGSFEEPEPATVVILGGGIGSLTSAIYLARAGLQPLVIEGENPGGLLTQSYSVQNWPGEVDIEGMSLVKKIKSQAEVNGALFAEEEVVAVDFSQHPLIVTTRSLSVPSKTRQILAESCIIGMGTQPNFLNVPGEQEYWGHGITNCAICDGALYRDQIVGVVGGGDAAVLEALYLSNIAKNVHLFVRKNQLRAGESGRIETLLERPNVTLHYSTEVVEIQGNGKNMTDVLLKSGTGNVRKFPLDGLFLAIGSRPNSKMFQNILDLDEEGYITLSQGQETSIPGVYAIGDIVDPVYKQAISAAGDGAKAALQSQKFLMEKSHRLKKTNFVTPLKTPGHRSEIIGAETLSPAPGTGEVVEVTSLEQFERELKQPHDRIVIDFYAPWCLPCKRLSPLAQSSAERLTGKVRFLKVNVDQAIELSRSYNIRAMPTAILLDASRKVIERKVGIEEIIDFLEQL